MRKGTGAAAPSSNPPSLVEPLMGVTGVFVLEAQVERWPNLKYFHGPCPW